MPTCRLCKHTFKTLRFQTAHIDVCTRCINTLNESPEPAIHAQSRLAEMLSRGMRRNAERDLTAEEEWKRRKAQWTLENLDAAVAKALPDWITRLLEKPENSTRDFRIMRAHRRGMLRMDGFAAYPGNWVDVARNIRTRDKWRCLACGSLDDILDVHHIIYLSNHGTNQQSNLITLCRPCHQEEHGREFDWPEAQDPESLSPIQPQPEQRNTSPAPPPPPPPPRIESPSPWHPSSSLRPTTNQTIQTAQTQEVEAPQPVGSTPPIAPPVVDEADTVTTTASAPVSASTETSDTDKKTSLRIYLIVIALLVAAYFIFGTLKEHTR